MLHSTKYHPIFVLQNTNRTMKPVHLSLRPTLFLISLSLMFGLANGQTKQDSLDRVALYKEIAHMDSVVFNAFNTRDIETFRTLFDESLEFYHDTGGLTNYDHTSTF